ncbi:MAG: putative SnoaL-like aldol condensation-catalyzing enzyme [Flavobacteriales bacterium]|jgi:predicted SnoaL-like aldol condensation-catalyzing enzyme
MSSKRKNQICALLKGIETGDEASVLVVNPNKYIQHNPHTHEGGEGLAALFKRISKISPRVNIVRVFSDGDYVFGHTEYDFSSSRIGFEIFRFEGDQTVEHWDNIQSRLGENLSDHSMVDGETIVTDLEKTEENRENVRTFVDTVLIGRQFQNLSRFVCSNSYTEHNPHLEDGLVSLHKALKVQADDKSNSFGYNKLHKLLAEGNFVLSVCEGTIKDIPTSFYDLYRLSNGKIVEHWDTQETIPPRSDWNNDNGKF